MAWGDTYLVDTHGPRVYRCPYCGTMYDNWPSFLVNHLKFCEKDYRNG
jgi:hypothetical protein